MNISLHRRVVFIYRYTLERSLWEKRAGIWKTSDRSDPSHYYYKSSVERSCGKTRVLGPFWDKMTRLSKSLDVMVRRRCWRQPPGFLVASMAPSVYCVWYVVPVRELRSAEKEAGVLRVTNRPILPTLNHQDGFKEQYKEETIPMSCYLQGLLSARPNVSTVSHLCSCLILGIFFFWLQVTSNT